MDPVTVSIATAVVILTAVCSVAGSFAVTKYRCERVELAAARAEAKAENAERDLGEFKLLAARQYVTEAMLLKIEERLVGAIDRIGDRFDRFVDGAAKRTSRASSS